MASNPKSPTTAMTTRARVSSAVSPSPDGSPPTSDKFDILRNDLRSMVSDIHSKLDKVILNQESLLQRVNTIENRQTEVENALSFTNDSVEELQQVATSTSSISKIQPQLQEVVKRLEKVEHNSLQLERYSRSFNLRFGGISEQPSELPSHAIQAVKEILADTFHLPDVTIEHAHRTGMKSSHASADNPRHIIAKCIYRPEKLSIVRQAKKALQGTEMFVMQDLPLVDAAKKRSLCATMKQAYDKGQKVVFRNGNLFIDGKEFHAASTATSPGFSH